MRSHRPSPSGALPAAAAVRRPNPRQSSESCRVQAVASTLLAVLTTLAMAPAQRPAWVPLGGVAQTVYELSTYDPGIGRPLAIASSTAPSPQARLMEWTGWSWCSRLSTVVPTYATTGSHAVGDHKFAFDVARRTAVLVSANPAPQPPSTWQWNGLDWAAVTTPTSPASASCVASLSLPTCSASPRR